MSHSVKATITLDVSTDRGYVRLEVTPEQAKIIAHQLAVGIMDLEERGYA